MLLAAVSGPVDGTRTATGALGITVALLLILAACGTDSTRSTSLTSPVTIPGTTSPSATSVSTVPSLPAVPDYRGRLGRFADLVLGSGIVPYGSPEHVQYLADCVESAGFDVRLEDGGLAARPGPGQEPFYRKALASCEQSAVDSGLVKELVPPDDEYLAAWWEAFMLTHECLVEAGYPVSVPPSQDAYVESDGQNWHPYEMLPPAVIPEVEQICPQDLLVLFEMLAADPGA